jgi:SulP family sulfate permease
MTGRSRPAVATAGGGLGQDLVAGSVTALVLLPQSIAFAQLAGLPAALGLAAGMLPPIVYALLGTSRVLSVGPVSVAALMVAGALAGLPEAGRAGAALILAVEVGLMLLLLGVLRLGFLTHFVSEPVLSGFTMGAALLIVIAQVPPLLGLGPDAPALTATGPALFGLALLAATLAVDPAATWAGRRLGGPPLLTRLLPRLGPVLIVLLATLFLAWKAPAPEAGYVVIGDIERVLPWFAPAILTAAGWLELLPSAALIALIGFIESIAIAKSMARNRGERIQADRELIALGAANVAGGLTGAMPVAGGFSRTLVNVAAGASSQRASVVTALWLLAAGAGLAGLLGQVPRAALAALIIAAVLPLLKPRELLRLWRYDRRDGAAAAAALLGTVLGGAEVGMALGIGLTVLLHLWRSSRPHIAILGRVPGRQVFRNVERHAVETWPELLLLRPDESLTFANADYVRQFVEDALGQRPEVRTVVIVCSAVNHIDASAVEAIGSLATALDERGLRLVLTEVKGPVLDRLARSPEDWQGRLTVETELAATLERLLPSRS